MAAAQAMVEVLSREGFGLRALLVVVPSPAIVRARYDRDIDVYQATGMVEVQLDVDATEALIRLRGYAFSHDMTISEVAWAIVDRQLSFSPDDFGTDPDGTATSLL
jgi:hypothetical protein